MFLKSFDGQITGRVNGWIFAKVVIDKGGHQDNVHHEIEAFCRMGVNIQTKMKKISTSLWLIHITLTVSSTKLKSNTALFTT